MKTNRILAKAFASVVGAAAVLGFASCKKEKEPYRFSYSEDHLDREGMIKKIMAGDKDAAADLAAIYDQRRMPEAAYYWFQIAMKLGRKDLNPEKLEYYKTGIPCIKILEGESPKQ